MTDSKRKLSGYLPAPTLVFLGVWLMLVIVGPQQVFDDPDTLWHIVVGEKMLDSREVIRIDPFSCAPPGQPWIAQSWLAECIMAALYRAGGFDTLSMATATVFAAFIAWMVQRMTHRGVHPLVATFLASLALIGTSLQFLARPLIASLVLLGWTYGRLCDYEAGRIPLRSLFWLLPVFVLWTNLHGGMLAGEAILGMAVAGWGAAKLLFRDPRLPGAGEWFVLVALVVGCAATSLVNPYGVELPYEWIWLASSPVLSRYISEHFPLQLWSPAGVVNLTIAALYLGALIGILPRRPRVTWFIPLFWLVAAVMRARHVTMFSVTAAIALAEMLPEVRWVHWLIRHGSRLLRPRPPITSQPGFRPWAVPAALVAVCFVLQTTGVSVPIFGHGWGGSRLAKHYPLELLPEMHRYSQMGSAETRIFNEYNFNGFLIFYAPEIKVFIDGRCELHREQRLTDVLDGEKKNPERLEEWANQYDLGLALVNPESGYGKYLSTADGWSVVDCTAAAALYHRVTRNPPAAAPDNAQSSP